MNTEVLTGLVQFYGETTKQCSPKIQYAESGLPVMVPSSEFSERRIIIVLDSFNEFLNKIHGFG